MQEFNWNDLRFFLATVRAGNPNAAANLLHVDHNTVRRRVAALESNLSTRLLDNRGDGQLLTEAGQRMLALAEAIERDIEQAGDDIAGKDFAVSGSVHLGTPDGLGTLFIAPRLAKLSIMHPGLSLELVIWSRHFNLSRREVDIAVQIDRPSQGRVVIRKLCDVTMRLYASPDYLARKPPIHQMADLAEHNFLSGAEDLDFGPSLNEITDNVATRAQRIVCTSSVAQLKAAASGAGICLFANFVAESEPGLVPVLGDQIQITREVWLTTHAELRDLARIKAVSNFLIQEFADAREGFE